MLRALALATSLLALGCLGESTTADMAMSMDQSQPVLDLAHVTIMCGISTCTGTCSACTTFGGGVCLPPCMTAVPSSCTAPAMCHPLSSASGDAGISTTLTGDCAGFDGYCG
jgi:hypothetical protein